MGFYKRLSGKYRLEASDGYNKLGDLFLTLDSNLTVGLSFQESREYAYVATSCCLVLPVFLEESTGSSRRKMPAWEHKLASKYQPLKGQWLCGHCKAPAPAAAVLFTGAPKLFPLSSVAALLASSLEHFTDPLTAQLDGLEFATAIKSVMRAARKALSTDDFVGAYLELTDLRGEALKVRSYYMRLSALIDVLIKRGCATENAQATLEFVAPGGVSEFAQTLRILSGEL